jgi:hypothetical protein
LESEAIPLWLVEFDTAIGNVGALYERALARSLAIPEERTSSQKTSWARKSLADQNLSVLWSTIDLAAQVSL